MTTRDSSPSFSPPLQEALQALVTKWRAVGAYYDTTHATMGMGWKACADELAEALSHPSPVLPRECPIPEY